MNKFFSLLLGASLLAACGTSAPESGHDHHGSDAPSSLADGLYVITKVALTLINIFILMHELNNN